MYEERKQQLLKSIEREKAELEIARKSSCPLFATVNDQFPSQRVLWRSLTLSSHDCKIS